MMLALQKVMVTTCGRWLKSAIKLALKDDFAEYTKPAKNSVASFLTLGTLDTLVHFRYFFTLHLTNYVV